MNEAKQKPRRRRGFIFLAIGLFFASFVVGVVSKFTVLPSWLKNYSVTWSDELGELQEDLPYGDGEYQRFDLYLPSRKGSASYGLVVSIHGGGFTAGDKKEDRQVLERLCARGYVAAGVNYTLPREGNPATVLSQSQEIKAAIPKVVEAAATAGYPIDKMAITGSSAGHALAMLYAYRDGKESPVPVVLVYGAVGPSDFRAEDWSSYGAGVDSEESRAIGAGLFSALSGETITAEEIGDGSYYEKVRPICGAEWVRQNPVPTVVAYGLHDKIVPFATARRLESALRESSVDYRFFVMKHSGHGLQNDYDVYHEWLETVDAYLDKYLPIQNEQ